MPWQFWSHQPPAHPNVPPACLLCLTASRTYPTALIDAATALALAAEDSRHDFGDPKVAEDFVSRVLALSEGEARAILAAVPEAGRAGCGLKGKCDFSGVAERFLNAPRLGAVPLSEPTHRRPQTVPYRRFAQSNDDTSSHGSFRLGHGLKVLAVLAAGAAVTGSARAFDHVGSVEGDISGYDVSAIHFDLSDDRPTTIAAVSFSLKPVPPPKAHIAAEISGARYSCVFTPPRAVCRPTGAAALLSDADSLAVTASP